MPCSPRTSPQRLSTCSESEQSVGMTTGVEPASRTLSATSSSRSRLRATRITFAAPFLASWIAVAAPTPDEAPVTRQMVPCIWSPCRRLRSAALN
eukprot:scaffold36667_cov35-Tisochrysis_lutea.AAC.2